MLFKKVQDGLVRGNALFPLWVENVEDVVQLVILAFEHVVFVGGTDLVEVLMDALRRVVAA